MIGVWDQEADFEFALESRRSKRVSGELISERVLGVSDKEA